MYLFLLYARVLKTGEYKSLECVNGYSPVSAGHTVFSHVIGSDELHCVGGKIIYGL